MSGTGQRRRHTRYMFGADVGLEVAGQRQLGRTANISAGGMFVRTDPAPQLGESLKLLLSLPDVPDICEIPCVVRWHRDDQGAGLEFQSVEPGTMGGLMRLINAISNSEV